MLVLVTTLLPSHSTPPENIIETSKWLAGIEYSRLDQGHLFEYAKENMVEETLAAIDSKAFEVADEVREYLRMYSVDTRCVQLSGRWCVGCTPSHPYLT